MSLHREIQKGDGSSPQHWHSYRCFQCEKEVHGAIIGFRPNNNIFWLICPNCGYGSVYNKGIVSPPMKYGATVVGLPQEIGQAYDEARNCMSVGAYTATELLCRKIIMHVGCDKDAVEGKSFAYYLDHLEDNGYITPSIKEWADLIRKNGNEATHKLLQVSEERAESTLDFTEKLLTIIYEMEHKKNLYVQSNSHL